MLYGDAYFIFFIASENYDTVSTTYCSSRHLVKTPVQYKNEIAEKRQTSVVCRFIIKNQGMIPPNIWQHIEITLFSVNKCAVIPYKHRHPKLRSPICSRLQIVNIRNLTFIAVANYVSFFQHFWAKQIGKLAGDEMIGV